MTDESLLDSLMRIADFALHTTVYPVTWDLPEAISIVQLPTSALLITDYSLLHLQLAPQKRGGSHELSPLN